MKFFFTLSRQYPWPTFLTLLAISFAGISEGFGISALLPVVNMVFHQKMLQSGGSGAPAWSSILDEAVQGVLSTLGLSSTVAVLLALFLCSIILKCILLFLANKQIGFTVALIATEMRLNLLKALFATRWEYFIRQPIGQLTNAVASEAHRASLGFHFGAKLASMGIEGTIYLTLACLVSWKATVLALGAGFFLLVVLRNLIKKNRRAGERQTTHQQSLIAQMTDILVSIKPLKAMAREDSADTVLSDRTRKLNRVQKQVLSKATLQSLQEPLIMAFLVLCLYAALTYWNLSLTAITAIVFFIGKSLKQFQKIQHEHINLVEYESAYWSLCDKIDKARNAEEVLAGELPPRFEKFLRMEAVNFAYDQHTVLSDVSIKIPAGAFVVLCGPSGSGKTTLVDLFIGLIRPQRGEVWIDDRPLAQIDLRGWRRMIGYVPQENLLLHDTVFENVSLGQHDVSERDVEAALRAAGAWDFVQQTPMGLFSVVGERGSMLSGGQRQRIAIARALVKRPKLLILDEATTALDPKTEREICATLQQLRGDITILAISHQSTLMECAEWAFRVNTGSVSLVKEPADISHRQESIAGTR